MSETVKPKRGRPQGREATIEEIEAELDRLVVKRRDEEEEQREYANTKARYAFKQQQRRAERHREWIEYHDRLGRQHHTLAEEHFQAAAQLRREGA